MRRQQTVRIARIRETRWLAALTLMCASTAMAADSTQTVPALAWTATRGITQTLSAEGVGAGRLNVVLAGTWYRQEVTFESVPPVNANIGTGALAFSFGANDYVDVFASVAAYGTSGWETEKRSGLGSVVGGAQGTLPLPADAPFRLGMQLYVLGGTWANQINGNRADGYNYFETRTSFDFAGKLLQTLVFGDDNMAFRVHLNEGLVKSVESGKENLLMLAGGFQGTIARICVVGLELNSRTGLSDIALRTDPLWITPSITFRTPYFVGIGAGVDVSLSKDRDPPRRALEPYRLFAGLTFSVDVLARTRQEASERQKKEAYEKAELQRKTERLSAETDSLTRKAKADSLTADRQKQEHARRADSLVAIADSLARKAKADSAALVETKKRLEEEKAKRTDAEKQLLSTGMLILDAVYFESGKTEISLNSRPYLQIIGKMLAKYPKLILEVGGHTDNVGGLAMNQRLSQLRAESVRAYLMSVAPELAGRLSAMGYGPSVPKSDNSTASGRKVNRRVELKVLNPDVLREYNP